eukprot:8407989-Alexandrium_andersonii.AAC.1
MVGVGQSGVAHSARGVNGEMGCEVFVAGVADRGFCCERPLFTVQGCFLCRLRAPLPTAHAH